MERTICRGTKVEKSNFAFVVSDYDEVFTVARRKCLYGLVRPFKVDNRPPLDAWIVHTDLNKEIDWNKIKNVMSVSAPYT